MWKALALLLVLFFLPIGFRKVLVIIHIFIFLFIMVFLFENGISFLNLSYIKKKSRVFPNWLMGYSTPQEFQKSADYSNLNGWFSIISTFFTSVIFFGLLISGLLANLEIYLHSVIPSNYWLGLVFLLVIATLSLIVSLPFGIYHEFKIEKAFGFSRYTVSLYLLDLVKQLLLSSVFLFLLYLGIWVISTYSGSFWWLYACLMVIGFSFLLSFFYPVLIAPLFNKFRPLEEGELKRSINLVAKAADFKMEGVYVMDGSRRSSHQNAYFTGFGKMRRIVLFDTLINSLSVSELTAVTAHEIGHWKKKHIVSTLVVSVVSNFVLFALLGFLLKWDAFFTAFGFEQAEIHSLIVILIFCLEPIIGFMRPFMNFLSRKHEFQADRFSVEATGSAKSMMSALLKLSRDNLSLSIPHPLYAFWNYSHPALQERISALYQLHTDSVTDDLDSVVVD